MTGNYFECEIKEQIYIFIYLSFMKNMEHELYDRL